MSKTRAELRRMIGVRTSQPFFRRLTSTYLTASGTGSTTTLVDATNLNEGDDYWNGQHIYFPATGEVREISDFTQSTGTVTWLAPIAAATTSATTYEIWATFSPHEVHDAINYALATAWPAFFAIAEDESLCVKAERGLTYTLPTTNTIKRLCQVWLKVYDSSSGSITTVGSATTDVIDSAASFTAADVGKYIAIYEDGDSDDGQVRAITALVSGTEVTTAAFPEAPPDDAKYMLLDKNTTSPLQVMLRNWVTDKPDLPTLIWFGTHPAGYEGQVIYLLYEYEFPTLSAETSSTDCPVEWVINMALSYMYMQKLSRASATEVDNWAAMYKLAGDTAQSYAALHRFQHLPGTLLQHGASTKSYRSDYPFR